MARSRGPRPWAFCSQSGWLSREQMACSTGMSRRKGRRLGASGLDWAKPVVLMIIPAPAWSSQLSTAVRHSASLRLATAMGRGFRPWPDRRSQKASMNAVFAACKWVR
ncbi:hypothetical protein D9M68_867080 [compost metagenome]